MADSPWPSAARLPRGRPRAAPSRSASPSPSSAGRSCPGRGSTRRSPWRHRPRAGAPAAGCLTSRHTTTDRARPSAPRSCSRNARTSRPRSPTSAITAMSAAVPRAIMPSNVLLPTPLPPNMPMRCPRPHVSRASMARTPVPMGATIGSRASGFIGGGCSGYSSPPSMAGRPSSGRPSPSMTRPSSSGPTTTAADPPRATRRSPGLMPVVVPSGTDCSRPSLNPTTSTGSTWPSRLTTVAQLADACAGTA